MRQAFGAGELDVRAELRTADSAPVGRRYEVILGDEVRDLQLLNELGVLSDELRVQMTVPRRLVERRCCVVAFLRGLFLGCGSISAPGAVPESGPAAVAPGAAKTPLAGWSASVNVRRVSKAFVRFAAGGGASRVWPAASCRNSPGTCWAREECSK